MRMQDLLANPTKLHRARDAVRESFRFLIPDSELEATANKTTNEDDADAEEDESVPRLLEIMLATAGYDASLRSVISFRNKQFLSE
jgi:hypothetical protein